MKICVKEVAKVKPQKVSELSSLSHMVLDLKYRIQERLIESSYDEEKLLRPTVSKRCSCMEAQSGHWVLREYKTLEMTEI